MLSASVFARLLFLIWQKPHPIIVCNYAALVINSSSFIIGLQIEESLPWKLFSKCEFILHILVIPPNTIKVTWLRSHCPGPEIATDTVANVTNIKFFSLATKNSGLVAKVATRFLYDLELN